MLSVLCLPRIAGSAIDFRKPGLPKIPNERGSARYSRLELTPLVALGA